MFEYKNFSPFLGTPKALFPNLVECPCDPFVNKAISKTIFTQANKKQAKKKPHDGEDNNEPMFQEHVLKRSWRGAVEDICTQSASHYSIHCSFSGSNWATSTFQQTQDGIILNEEQEDLCVQQWGEKYNVTSFCCTCKAAGKYVLLAVGVTNRKDKITLSGVEDFVKVLWWFL